MNSRTARPIVLVHGWGGSFDATWRAHGWDAACLALGRPAPAVNLAGHGLGPRSYDPARYADLASRLEETLPSGRVLDAVGFSLGAKLLLELACRDAGRFGRLVLGGLGANVFAPEALGSDLAVVLEDVHERSSGSASASAAATATATTAATAALRELAYSAVLAGNDPLAVAAVLRRPPNPVLTVARLAAVTCPVLLIAGDGDKVAQPLAPLAEALRAARSHTLPGVGHLELPADLRFRASALAFLTADDHE